MGYLGEELALGHRDGLRLGVAGMHQTLEHDGAVVDVLVVGQVHPAQAAVRDASLDHILIADLVARGKLRQERICAAAVRAPALRQRPAVGRRSADRTAAVPAEPLRLGHHGIGHQRFERIRCGHPRDLDQTTAEAPGRRERPRHRGRVIVRLCVIRAGRRAVDVVVEVRTEDRLGGHRADRRHGLHVEIVEPRRLRSGAGVVE